MSVFEINVEKVLEANLAFGAGDKFAEKAGKIDEWGDFEADALGAVVFFGGEEEASIAAAEVVDGLSGFELSQFEHFLDGGFTAGDIGDT